MKKIYKYPLKVTGHQSISVPRLNENSNFRDQFLSAHYQSGDGICIWCLVDEYETCRDVEICIVGTGVEVDAEISKDNYLGTCILYGGSLVWHVFLIEEDCIE